jgi:UDP-N-acetyl-D-galactosamine dehydrogenase
VILSGRRVNDNMGKFIANNVIKLLIRRNHIVSKSNALILGITFKENCPDIRNSKVIDIIKELQAFNISIDIYDPYADKHEVKKVYGLELIENITQKYDSIILAVSHEEFKNLDYLNIKKDNLSVIFDTKAFLDRTLVDARL